MSDHFRNSIQLRTVGSHLVSLIIFRVCCDCSCNVTRERLRVLIPQPTGSFKCLNFVLGGTNHITTGYYESFLGMLRAKVSGGYRVTYCLYRVTFIRFLAIAKAQPNISASLKIKTCQGKILRAKA